jgi:hypothetical protein
MVGSRKECIKIVIFKKSDRLKIHHDGERAKDTGVTLVSLAGFLKNQ